MIKRRRKVDIIDFNLTPLVDVMFILMIFLIITAHYSTLSSIRVNLPKAQTSQTAGDVQSIVITLTQDEKIYFGGAPITLDKLKFEVINLAKQKNQPVVIIQADEGSSTGKLVSVMDVVSQTGLSKISIQTKGAAQ
jgi:biopolymer transport protein ExbD